jgi:Zn-dependent protease/predicted transcriptional regulator
MFAKRIELFRLSGFRVSLDLSWFLIAALLVWSLATFYFPWALPGMGSLAYWSMGLLGAVGLFASIILHELAHALVARRYDLPISGITLFIFGGVAEMDDEPATPAAEFWMAIAGPIASFAIAAGLFLLLQSRILGGQDAPLVTVVAYLATINTVLAIFNLLPAFPLDGGRVLRALLWWWKGDVTWATRIAAASGIVLALALVALGVLNIIGGALVAGVWQMLLGFFLYSIAGASRTSAELRRELKDVPVSRIMSREPVAVDADLPLQGLVEAYFYRYHLKSFPVQSNGWLVGCVHLTDVNQVARDSWASTRVRDVMRPCGSETVVSPDAQALEALRRMQRTGNDRLVVAAGERLDGVITADDIMNFVAVRLELRDQPSCRRAAAEKPTGQRTPGASRR